MIVFDLTCICGCQFEGWFDSHDDFTKQLEQGKLECPRCGGAEIRKILSPVTVCTKAGDKPWKEEDRNPDAAVAEMATEALSVLQEYIEKNFEDVGAALPEESLKMHYGIKEGRNIRGVATAEEEKMLKEEGIKLVKVPRVAKKKTALH